MNNKAMQRKLESTGALDLRMCARTADGDYLLTPRQSEFAREGGTDFCDSSTESWIWSVGECTDDGYVAMPDGSTRMMPKGTCLASTSSKFYQAEDKGWRCIWLR